MTVSKLGLMTATPHPELCTNMRGELGCPTFESYYEHNFYDELREAVGSAEVPEHMHLSVAAHNILYRAATDYGADSVEYAIAEHALRLEAAKLFISIGACPVAQVARGRSPQEVVGRYSADCRSAGLAMVEFRDRMNDRDD